MSLYELPASAFRKGAGPLSTFPPIRRLARRSLRHQLRLRLRGGYSIRFRYGEVNSPSLNIFTSLTLGSTAYEVDEIEVLR